MSTEPNTPFIMTRAGIQQMIDVLKAEGNPKADKFQEELDAIIQSEEAGKIDNPYWGMSPKHSPDSHQDAIEHAMELQS